MKKILSLMLFLMLAVSVFAVPANRRPVVVKQSDGTMLTIVMHGDEALHYYTTLDGKYIVKGECGDYCYATFSNGGFVSTGVLAHNKDERNDAEKELLDGIDYNALGDAVSETHMARSARYRSAISTRSASASGNSITKGDVLVPVLLVEFNDVKFAHTKEDIDKLLNEPNYKYNCGVLGVEGYGSARDYFIAQSGGQFTPKFVVTDIVTLTHNMEYYGGNNSAGTDKNPQAMISKGIEKADPSIDFSQFDNNGDGEVEFLYCIYAGYSEANGANANTVWPHQWSLSAGGSKKKADGVFCDVYACSSELNMTEAYEKEYGKWLAGIGTLCHEFSHILGLHDVYDTSYKSGNWGMDDWDIMGNGNYNTSYGYIPVGYNSYQKDLCGWKELEVLTENGVYSMMPQSQGGVGYKILNDANPNEYFILENRKREAWDQPFVADGMMIIHVDYDKDAWNRNEINTKSGHPRFQIIPADNELLFYSSSNSKKFYESLAGDLWPGKNNNDEFTNTSLPAAKVYAGGYLNKPVTNIRYENYVASFNFVCGEMEAPVAMPATEVQGNSFIANWSAVEYASEYLVELYKRVKADINVGDVEKCIEEDFLNCSKAATAIQDNMDAYMSVKGWSGNNVYSETGMLCIGSLNNAGSLTTPMIDSEGNASVKFKVAKYNSNAGAIKLIVDVLDASGVVLATDVVSAAGTVELTTAVTDGFCVRFSTDADNDNKRVLVDDISVVVQMPYTKVLVEECKTTQNSYLFADMEQGEYAYRVKAVSGTSESAFSEYAKVVLKTTTVVETPQYEDYVTVYAVSGVKVYEGEKSALHNLASGIYLIRSNAGVKKIKIE